METPPKNLGLRVDRSIRTQRGPNLESLQPTLHLQMGRTLEETALLVNKDLCEREDT